MAACLRCTPASHLVASADATSCTCAPSFVPDGSATEDAGNSTVELLCTCGSGKVIGTFADACMPCEEEGYAKQTEFGTERSLCKYGGSNTTLPLFLGAASGLLVVFGVASFALRKSKGGVLGALHRLFAGAFGLAVVRTMGEAFDLTSDSVALWDVMSNDDLEAFHTTYVSAATRVFLVVVF